MYSVNITSAKANLSSLLREIEDYNEEIIIERAGRPIAKIIKYKPMKSINRIGYLRIKLNIPKILISGLKILQLS